MKRVLIVSFILGTFLLLLAVTVLVWRGTTDHVGTADVALVLGNKVNPDGTPSPRLKARLDTAVAFFKKDQFKLIIVSGGTGIEGVPEGTAMKRYLVEQGIPEAAVIVDDQGVDTRASAKNTAQFLRSRKLKSVFVITQYFHVPRSVLAIEKLGISPVFHAHPDYFESRDIYSTLREIPAYAKYCIQSPDTQTDTETDLGPATK